jgi:hypothetical protein
MEIRVLPPAILVLLLGACAGSPEKPAPAAAVPPPAAAAQNPGVAYDSRLAESNKRAREMGYHMETRHGEQFYCRSTAPIGSRLEQKECLTAESMAQAVQMADESQAAQRQGQLCQGGGCVIK